MCYAIAFYDVSCALLYNADNFADGQFFQKGNFVSLALIIIFFTWFSCDYIKVKPQKSLYFVWMLMVVSIPVIIFDNSKYTLSLDNPQPKHIQLGNWFTTTYYEVEPGLVPNVEQLIMAISMIYFFILFVRYYRKKPSHETLLLIVSMAAFFVAGISDTITALGLYPIVYTSEYAFLFIMFSMGYALQNRFFTLYDEVEDLNANLEQKVVERTEALEAANEEMAVINRNLQETSDALWGEMALAKKIQTVLLPDKPKISGYDISVYMEPADEVGGDYYDVMHVDGTDWLVIGDVSGHGVPAGLIMMMVQTSIHSVIKMAPREKPSVILSRVNDVITENIRKLGEDKYMTITVFAYIEDGKFCFSGLHQDIMVYRAVAGDVQLVATNGVWIGILD